MVHEIERVKECYKNALQVALEKQCKSIAFPLISTGTYGFPKPEALQIAISVISEFLLFHDMKVFLVVYDRTSYSLSEKLFTAVAEFIDDNYIEEHPEYYQNRRRRRKLDIYQDEVFAPIIQSDELCESKALKATRSLDNLMNELDESFSQSLLRLIDEKCKTDVEIYMYRPCCQLSC